MEKPKPKKWKLYVVYAALILPTLVLFLNDNFEYEIAGRGINPLIIVLVAGAGVVLFYQNFTDKTQLETKPADIGPSGPMGAQGFKQDEYPKPYSPSRDYGKPPFN